MEVDGPPSFPYLQANTHTHTHTQLYCLETGLSYKQGLNDILAPFLALGMLPDTARQCMAAVISRLVLHAFVDDGFAALQCVLRMLGLMLRYHDPTLARIMDQNEVPPPPNSG